MRVLLKWALGAALLLAFAAAVSVVCGGLGDSGGQAAAAGSPNTPIVSANIVNSTASPVPVAGTMKIDPNANTVKVSSSKTAPVYVAAADAPAKQPIPFYLTAELAAGETEGQAVATVSDGKWFIVEGASVVGSLPQDQSWIDCTLMGGGGRTLSALGLTPLNSVYDPLYHSETWFLNATPCRLYVPPLTELYWSVRRDGDDGTARITVLLTGYLTDAP